MLSPSPSRPLPARAEAPADSARVSDLERRVDALTQELEALQLGPVADTTSRAPRTGFAPGASKVYAKASGVSIGGYGEFLFERPDKAREDGAASGGQATADVLRGVLYVGNKFNDTWLFNSEIEFEHAGVFDAAEVQTDPVTGTGEAELTGEATLEFAYIEWAKRRSFGLRIGKLLVPVGNTNEIHEPPTFPTAERPDVEQLILPTTWTAKGVGAFGDLGNGVSWRAYLVEGLDGSHFAAENGIREGRQETSRAVLTHPAVTARVDWSGGPGLTFGVSGWTGDTWQGPDAPGTHLAARVSIADVHARLDWRGLKARALAVRGHVEHNEELSDALGLVGDARLGEFLWGGYVEAAYDVLAAAHPGSSHALLPYARFEGYDTQDGVAAPASEDPAFHGTTTVGGVEYKPHPDVALKLDRAWRKNDAHTGVSQWNFAVGYLF